VEEIWKRFKEAVFESIDSFVPHKIPRKKPAPEYYNKKVKRLKVKVRRVHNKRKVGQR
jgi:beta-phosphoglucomutase-like phosphatase (HAD superfamily)